MPWVDVASLNLTLLCTSLVAALMAGVLLSLEFFASRRLAQQAPGVFAVLLAGMAVSACLVRGASYIAGGCGLLAAVLLITWPVSFEFARARMMRLIAPKF